MSNLQSPADFSGLWRLNFEKSTFRSQTPKEMLIKIEHREPSVVQEIHVRYGNGHEQILRYTYETRGQETTHSISGGLGRSRAHWESSELVIESKLTTPYGEFHFLDYWSLSADGRSLTMAHRNDDLDGQIAVLEKEPVHPK